MVQDEQILSPLAASTSASSSDDTSDSAAMADKDESSAGQLPKWLPQDLDATANGSNSNLACSPAAGDPTSDTQPTEQRPPQKSSLKSSWRERAADYQSLTVQCDDIHLANNSSRIDRTTPKSLQSAKRVESKLHFAEMVANALSKKGKSPTALLSHMDELKLTAAILQQEQEEEAATRQIGNLPKELIDIFDQGGFHLDKEEDLIQWLLPMQDKSTGRMVTNTDQIALLQQVISSTSDELDTLSEMGIVKSVLQSNFKAINGSWCLQVIQDYAMLKFGKKDKNRRPTSPWEELLKMHEEEGQTDDVHLRVRNALVQWVVRQVLGTSKDEIPSKLCFRAIFLISSLKLELERVAPVALRQSTARLQCNNPPDGGDQDAKRRSTGTGLLVDAPPFVKKLLNRGHEGPNSTTSLGAPVDLPPEQGKATDGSDNVEYVRETLKKTEEDNMEAHARITSRRSTLSKIDENEAILGDDHHLNTSEAADEETNSGASASKSSPGGGNPTDGTETDEANQSASNKIDHNGAEAAQITEDASNLPLPVQDALRVIRTILGPSHPKITVSLCFEALRVYAALIKASKSACGEGGTGQSTVASSRSQPTQEEVKLKSLERAVLRRGAIIPVQQQLQHQEETERREQKKTRSEKGFKRLLSLSSSESGESMQ